MSETTARYVIVSDADAPSPSMVCQLVPGLGYCYMNRGYNKPSFDGMRGDGATPIEAFGFEWTEDADGWTHFDQTGAVTATYQDGSPRRWQSSLRSFDWRRLKMGATQVERVA